jgi:hypothetical protein
MCASAMMLLQRGDDAVASDVVTLAGNTVRQRREAMQFCKWRRDGFAERLDEPAGDRGRRFHGDLLAENRAQAQLESVEGTWHRRPGLTDRRRQARVPAQMLRDEVGPRIEIEQCPDSAQQGRQDGREAVREFDGHGVFRLRLHHLDPAPRLAQPYGPGVRGLGHVLDAVERPRGQKSEDPLPVVGRAIRELQGGRLTLDDRRAAFSRFLPQTCRAIP